MSDLLPHEARCTLRVYYIGIHRMQYALCARVRIYLGPNCLPGVTYTRHANRQGRTKAKTLVGPTK